MKNNDKFIIEVLNGFQTNRGKGNLYCFKPFDYADVVKAVVSNFRRKRPDSQILFVVDKYQARVKIVQACTEINSYYNIKILTKDYIQDKYSYTNELIVFIDVDDIYKIEKLNKTSKFTLAIFTKYPDDNNFIMQLKQILPDINITVNKNDIITDKLKLPVKEYRIGVDFDKDDLEQYTKYTNFINDAMKVFNNLDTVKKCRVGDDTVSAAQFRYNLALENNWSEELDTSTEFGKQIDEIFNPNALFEKANIVYSIFKKRIDLLTDNKYKLEAISKIVRENKDKQILIVSMRGSFATEICMYLNNIYGNYCCGEFHNEIESRYLYDEEGNSIKYKSGENKGKLRPFGAIALSKKYLELFNDRDNYNHLQCLSIKNSSDEKLTTKVDIVIFTSPMCLKYDDFILRYGNIEFSKDINIYKLYTNNTIEYTRLQSQPIRQNVDIIEDNSNVKFDEEKGNIIL